MKSKRTLGALFLLCILTACSGEKDNSQPPVPLTDIEDDLFLELNWKLDTRASSNSASYRLRPLLVGDRLYSIDTSGLVSGIDVATGRKLWKFDTELPTITGLGGNDEILIATSRDGVVAAYRQIEEGLELLWSTRINSEIRAVPVVDNGQVLVRSVDGKLRSLSVSDGAEQWLVSHRVPVLSLTGNSEPLVAGELVFSGFDDGKLVAYDRKTGQTRWESTISLPSGRTEVERLVDLDGRFVLHNGVIYIAAFQGRLAAVQAVSGDLLWSRQFTSFQSIAIDDHAIYLSAESSDIWSIDLRTGSAFWRQDVLYARKVTAPSIIGDNLVVADLDGYLHWFDKQDGKLVGRIRTSEARNYIQPITWQDSVLTLDKFGFLSSVSLRQ